MIRPLALGLLAPLVVTGPAYADEPAVITSVTSEDVPPAAGSPWLPTRQRLAVWISDNTPSDPAAYRIDVEWHGSYDGAVVDRGPDGGLVGLLPTTGLVDGELLPVTVVEVLPDGITTSSTVEVTYHEVRHPELSSIGAVKRDGRLSLDVAEPLTVAFGNGRWEVGTTFDTRVYVSDGSTFTADDLEHNLDGGALVETYGTSSPTSVAIPKRLVGKYLWASVVGRIDGQVAWGFTMRPARVVVVKDRWRLKRLTHRRESPCTPEHTEAMRLRGGGGRHVFLQEKWGRRPWKNSMRQTTLPSGRFDLGAFGPAAKRYRTRFWDVVPAHPSGQMRWTQRLVVPEDAHHERLVGLACTVTLN